MKAHPEGASKTLDVTGLDGMDPAAGTKIRADLATKTEEVTMSELYPHGIICETNCADCMERKANLRAMRGATRRVERIASILTEQALVEERNRNVAENTRLRHLDTERLREITDGMRQIADPLTLTPVVVDGPLTPERESGPEPRISYDATPDTAFTVSYQRLALALLFLQRGFTNLSGILLRNCWVIADGKRRVAFDGREEILHRDGPKEGGWMTASPEMVAQDVATVEWLQRDEIEIARERANDGRVTGDHWVGTTRQRSKGIRTGNVTLHTTGAVAEKAWLDAQIAQLRITYRELMQDARRKTGRANVSDFAQLQAIQRQVESLRLRHNYRRHVEALYVPEDAESQHEAFNEAFAKVEERRKAGKLTFAQALKALERKREQKLAEWVRGESNEWVAVEGLIAV